MKQMFSLEFSCFFYDSMDVGNLVFGSSPFPKSSLNIWKFSAHVLLKSNLENFEHYFASVWSEWSHSVVSNSATTWSVAYQVPPSMGFSRQEYWSGLPFPSPGDLPNPGIKPGSPALRADALPSEPPGKPSYVLWLWGSKYLLAFF